MKILETPEDAAAWVAQNIEGLTPAQIADIESKVTEARPSSRMNGFIIQDITVIVLYGCRIRKAVEAMKDVRKMADRWSLAWNGSASGRSAGVMTTGNVAWIKLCEQHWRPFVRKHVERSLFAGSRLTKAQALAFFDPKLNP